MKLDDSHALLVPAMTRVDNHHDIRALNSYIESKSVTCEIHRFVHKVCCYYYRYNIARSESLNNSIISKDKRWVITVELENIAEISSNRNILIQFSQFCEVQWIGSPLSSESLVQPSLRINAVQYECRAVWEVFRIGPLDFKRLVSSQEQSRASSFFTMILNSEPSDSDGSISGGSLR